MKLDKVQQAAAWSKEPLVAVVAGPGSGKTETLAQTIASKAAHYGAHSIVVITFTNAAADELKARVKLTGFGFIGTLHAFLLYLLRRHYKLVGLPCRPVVAADETVEELAAEVLATMGVKCPKRELGELLRRSDLIVGSPLVKSKKELVAVETHRQLRQSGLLSLDGVLAYGLALAAHLRAQRQTGECQFFDHLFVDEVQDSSATDWAIYEMLPFETRFVVGDPDQSIYGFRGADVAAFVSRLKDPDWDIHVLERSYRCPERVAVAASLLIANNEGRLVKDVEALKKDDPGIFHTLVCDSWQGELHRVAELVDTDMPDDCAVLCRSNRMAQEVANFLKARGFAVAHAKKPEVPAGWSAARALVAALESESDVAWLEFVRLTRGKDDMKVAATNAALEMKSVRCWLKEKSVEYFSDALLTLSKLLPPEARRKLLELFESEPDYGRLSMKLAELEACEHLTGIHVGTVHSAKGREWNTVIVCGLEEGAFPKKGADLEEERRLMFVAATRAKYRLLLTYSTTRPQYRGEHIPPGPPEPREPSRFIGEMKWGV